MIHLLFKSRPKLSSMDFQGLKIRIENPVGSVRSGTDNDGHKWSTTMKAPYGFIQGVDGTDGDELDCYVGKNKTSQKVFVAHIKHPDGRYDEDKCFLGYNTKEEVTQSFKDHYDNFHKFFGGISEMSMDEFKKHIREHHGAPVSKLGVLIKARKPAHPLNMPYRQNSGRMVMRVIRGGKATIVPVPKKKKKKSSAPKATAAIHTLPLKHIEAAEGGQIRKKFDKKELADLASGIESQGLIQPILVRPHPTKSGKFEIVAGERRYRAHGLLNEAGKTAKGTPAGHIQAIVRHMSDEEKDAMQMQENIQRHDNTPMEIAHAIRKQADAGMSFEDIARTRGKKIDYIKNHHSLTTLDPDIQTMVERGEVPKKAGYILSELPLNEQRVFAGKFVNEKWSVTTLGNHIFNFKNQQKLFEAGAEKTDEMKAAEEQLEGKNPEEINARLRDILSKHVALIDKFTADDGIKLSTLALAASGTLDQNMKYFEMVQERLANIIHKMKTEHHNLTAPSMFGKSRKETEETLKTFERLQKDFSVLKSLKKFQKK